MSKLELFRLSCFIIIVGGALGLVVSVTDMVFMISNNISASDINFLEGVNTMGLITSIIQVVVSGIETACGVYSFLHFDDDAMLKKFFIWGCAITGLCLVSTVLNTIFSKFNTLTLILGLLFSALYLCCSYLYKKERE